MNPIAAYTRWLHTRWPAGDVERLPEVRADFSTRVPGLYIVGDLAGVPLFKFSADSGARAVRTILADPKFRGRPMPDPMDSMAGVEPPYDLVIIGAGVAGMSAALEAKRAGLSFLVVEAAQAFSTVHNFLRGKPIYTYPTDMTPAGELRVTAATKEELLEELHAQASAAGIEPAMGEALGVKRRRGASGGLLEVELAPHAAAEGDDALLAPEEARHRPRGPHAPRPLMAHRVIVAIGRSGAYRMLDVPGEELPKVYNRLHDPADFRGQRVLVVGGGDSAVETAVALATSGAEVTLSYRGKQLTRPKPANLDRLRQLTAALSGAPDVRSTSAGGEAREIEAPSDHEASTATGAWMRDKQTSGGGGLGLRLGTLVERIDADAVVLRHADQKIETVPNDAVFTMIGREAPLDFFHRTGIPVVGDKGVRWWATLLIALVIFTFVYHWKKTGISGFGSIPILREVVTVGDAWARRGWWPYNVPGWLSEVGGAFANPANPLGTLRVSLGEPGFWYSLAYCAAVVVFGVKRIRKRRTPYVKWQTATLALIQVIPLFLLPYLVLPWMGHNGLFDGGVGKWFADTFFPVATYTEHGREYWRAFGFILAWPLFIWNVFTSQPMWGWLILSFVQTFVIIPGIVYIWGKGAYCGWICSCGALAETLGDSHRHKMPHGPGWNRFNMLGQVFLAFALVILLVRIVGWVTPAAERARIIDVRYESHGSSHVVFNREIDHRYSWPNGWIRLPDGTVAENVSKSGGFTAHTDLRLATGQTVALYSSPLQTLHDWTAGAFGYLLYRMPVLNYVWFVDLLWAGILGVGLYWHFSGRVWCRFACPLAAWMHIVHRFSRFRILAVKERCISCNVCTSVCHQGIDIMSFANKGEPMADPQCVRCSACVQMCPTGVLSFGQVNPRTGEVIREDPAWLAASPVRMVELRVNGKRVS